MSNEFKKSKNGEYTIYTLESATGGGTSAGAVASVSKPMGNVIKRGGLITQEGDSITVPVKQKPRQGALKTQTGAGAHRDKKKEQKQGKEKHKKPYMEDIAARIETLKSKLDEVSLGDYERKAKMKAALAKMGAAFGGDPEQRAKDTDIARRREAGLARAKVRSDKTRADAEAKRKADYEAEIRAKYAGVDIDAEIEKLKPALKRAYDEYQYGARNTWSQGRDEYHRLQGQIQQLTRAKEILAQGEVDEDAPFLAKAAGGLALGALGAAGAPAIVGMLGPLLGIPLAAYGAYNSAKGGMWAVEKLWDLASKKLGGDDKVAQYVDSKISKLPPEKAKAASAVVDKLSENRQIKKDLVESWNQTKNEDHTTASDGWGKGSYTSYEVARHGRGVAEEEQRLDPKCWKGYKKQGTKMKGGVRVNNCVPAEGIEEAGSPAQQAAIAISMKKVGKKPKNESAESQFDLIEEMVEDIAIKQGIDSESLWDSLENIDDLQLLAEAEAWQTSKGKSKSGGLNKKGVASYRRSHPGSKLQTAVTTKPSKLKKGSKAAKRRKSFCARMGGVKGPMKKPNGKPTRKALALRKWNCHEDVYMNDLAVKVAEKLDPQAPADVWIQDFQKADPNKYHQFKNKTPQKKAQMAQAAHYAANEPSKKK